MDIPMKMIRVVTVIICTPIGNDIPRGRTIVRMRTPEAALRASVILSRRFWNKLESFRFSVSSFGLFQTISVQTETERQSYWYCCYAIDIVASIEQMWIK